MQIILFYRLQNTKILFARKKDTSEKEKMEKEGFSYLKEW